MDKTALVKLAKKVGVLLTDEGYKLEIFVPAGKCIATNMLHFQSFYLKGWLRSDLYDEIALDLKWGLIDCTDCTQDEDCDYCHETKQNGLIPKDVREEYILHNPELQLA